MYGNAVRWSYERSSSGRISKAKKAFNSLIEELELIEMPLSHGKFIWSKAGSDFIHSLLDRFLISKELDDLYKEWGGS